MRAIFALVLCLLVALAQAKGELKREFMSLNNRAMAFGQPSGKKTSERVPLKCILLKVRVTPFEVLLFAFFPNDEQRMIISYAWEYKGGNASHQGRVLGLFSMMASEFDFNAALALCTRSLEPAYFLSLSFSFFVIFFLRPPPSSLSHHRLQRRRPHLFSSLLPLIENKNPEIEVNWSIPALQSPPAEKLGPVKATVGDTVVFKWSGGLSYALYQISKRELVFFSASFLTFSMSER